MIDDWRPVGPSASASAPRAQPPTDAGPTHAYRLSDAERDEAISALGEAYAEGRLDAQEFEDRMAVAAAARFARTSTRCSTTCPSDHGPAGLRRRLSRAPDQLRHIGPPRGARC